MSEDVIAPKPWSPFASASNLKNLSATLKRKLPRLFRNQALLFGILVVLLYASIAVVPGQFASHDPFQLKVEDRQQPPSAQHWFGTDELGRDIYSRVIYGIRLSFTAGFLVVIGGLMIGTFIGIYAGYRGGTVDNILMRAADVFLAFPGLIMAMAFVAALGPGLNNAMMALNETN